MGNQKNRGRIKRIKKDKRTAREAYEIGGKRLWVTQPKKPKEGLSRMG